MTQDDRPSAPTRANLDARWALAISVTLLIVFVTLFDVVIVWSTRLQWGHDDVTPFGLIGLVFTIFGVVLAAAIFVVQQRAAAASRAESLKAFARIERSFTRVRQSFARAQQLRSDHRLTAAQLDVAGDVFQDLQALPPAMVLWVDDNPRWVENERAILAATGSRSVLVTDTFEALKLLDSDNQFDLVITDMRRGDEALAGYDLLAGVVERVPGLGVILYSTSDDPAHEQQWRMAGGQRSTYDPIGLFKAIVDALRG
ncbi:response regulator [Curtobacterium sp. L1-20]|uniref:response regulator n=1 Tax=Curtobacterium sp. L1-20 TaxID=3138181 RepID=UPI003B52FE8F